MSTPGLRIPVTADEKLFTEAGEIGRTILGQPFSICVGTNIAWPV